MRVERRPVAPHRVVMLVVAALVAVLCAVVADPPPPSGSGWIVLEPSDRGFVAVAVETGGFR